MTLPYPAREALLHHLPHHRGIAHLRLAHQQVDMLGHHHVADHGEAIVTPGLLQNLQQQVAPPRRAQPGMAVVTTASNEVQMLAL